MSEKLTQEEAERLLSMLKKSLIEYLMLPQKGDKVEFDVCGDNKKDLFSINIFRGKINGNKINYNARIKSNGIMLLELHINATNRHINPDGTIITGSHWHIYKEGFGNRYAFPADDIEDNNFVQNTINFLDEFNVIEKPVIHCQSEIL